MELREQIAMYLHNEIFVGNPFRFGLRREYELTEYILKIPDLPESMKKLALWDKLVEALGQLYTVVQSSDDLWMMAPKELHKAEVALAKAKELEMNETVKRSEAFEELDKMIETAIQEGRKQVVDWIDHEYGYESVGWKDQKKKWKIE